MDLTQAFYKKHNFFTYHLCNMNRSRTQNSEWFSADYTV